MTIHFSDISPRIKLIAALVIAMVVIFIGVMTFRHFNQPPPPSIGDGSTGRKYDPTSHETISDPAGKGPDTYGTNPGDTITFLGTVGLTNAGLSSDQLAVLKVAYSKYATASKINIRYVSVNVDSITTSVNTADPDLTVYTMTFPTVINLDKNYTSKITYVGVSDVDLFLYDNTGAQVFDSGILDYYGD